MEIYRIWLVDPEDESYRCDYTVLASSPEAAKAFGELHNPGKVCVEVKPETPTA